MCMQVMYSEFLTLVHSGNVKAAGIDDSTDKIYFTMRGHSLEQAAPETAAPMIATTSAAADSGEFSEVLPNKKLAQFGHQVHGSVDNIFCFLVFDQDIIIAVATHNQVIQNSRCNHTR